MKKYIYICVTCLLCGLNTQAQKVYNYTDLGVLFSSENTIGTARFAGLNGAMGAVGGDLSSINVNPAGIAVFNNSEFNLTLGNQHFNNTTTYYGSSIKNKSSVFNTEQLGGVFVLKDDAVSINNSWNKINLAINYQKTNNFNTQDLFFGNSKFAGYNNQPNNPDTTSVYNDARGQKFYNNVSGTSSVFNIGLAGQYGDKIYLGASLNFHNLNFSQSTELQESDGLNKNDNKHLLNTDSYQTLSENSGGFSFNSGIIYKPTNTVRLGFAYESPTWYSNIKEQGTTDLRINYNPTKKGISAYKYSPDATYLQYKLRTPGKLTASGAVVIGKYGFINLDYSYKTYNSLSLSKEGNTRNDNRYFTDVLHNTNNVNIGGELRLKTFSLRGGFGYQQSPFKKHVDPRDIDILKLGDKYSGSLGVGIRFGSSKLNIAYRKTFQNNEYDLNGDNQQIYQEDHNGDYLKSATIKNRISRFVATYTYSF